MAWPGEYPSRWEFWIEGMEQAQLPAQYQLPLQYFLEDASFRLSTGINASELILARLEKYQRRFRRNELFRRTPLDILQQHLQSMAESRKENECVQGLLRAALSTFSNTGAPNQK